MKKLLTILFLLFACFMYASDSLDINGTFNKPSKGIPKNWAVNAVQPCKIKRLRETSSNIVELTLPNEFYGVPGIESAIYLDNIILSKSPSMYALNVKPQIGKIENNRWIIVPTEKQQGKHLLGISIITKNQKKLIAKGNIELNIAPATAGAGKKLTLLIIGDSLTAATHYTREIARLLSQKGNPEWVMLGTRRTKSGVAHEGYGGWTWGSFISKYKDKPVKEPKRGSSPFIFKDNQGKPKLDVQRYFKDKCSGVKPDVITVMLGINDCFPLQGKLNSLAAVNRGIDKVFKNAEILIAQLRKAAPNAIIGICLTTPPNVREKPFLSAYKGKYHRWSWKQVQHILVQRQIKYFGNREKDNIYIIPTELNIDCVDGYPKNNGVHPNKKGYNQIGSAIYCWLKWQLYTNTVFK
jgi:lysophospholipase L1-like esterase